MLQNRTLTEKFFESVVKKNLARVKLFLISTYVVHLVILWTVYKYIFLIGKLLTTKIVVPGKWLLHWLMRLNTGFIRLWHLSYYIYKLNFEELESFWIYYHLTLKLYCDTLEDYESPNASSTMLYNYFIYLKKFDIIY